MSLFHFHVTQIKRSSGQSAVACAAYRAGEKLKSEYYGEVSDYTRKGGVVESGIMLPEYVPQNLSDRETLWNEVEKIEKGKKAQLAYSFDFALQNEFPMEENISLAKETKKICFFSPYTQLQPTAFLLTFAELKSAVENYTRGIYTPWQRFC